MLELTCTCTMHIIYSMMNIEHNIVFTVYVQLTYNVHCTVQHTTWDIWGSDIQ